MENEMMNFVLMQKFEIFTHEESTKISIVNKLGMVLRFLAPSIFMLLFHEVFKYVSMSTCIQMHIHTECMDTDLH